MFRSKNGEVGPTSASSAQTAGDDEMLDDETFRGTVQLTQEVAADGDSADPAAVIPAPVNESTLRSTPLAHGGPAAQPGPSPAPSRARELVNQKGRRLNLVQGGALFSAITRAVGTALDAHVDWVDVELKRCVVRDARANLVDELRSSSKKVRGLPEQAFLKKVTAERDRIVSERQQAEEQLAHLMGQLSAKRNDLHVRSQMIVSESAAAGEMLDREMSDQLRTAFEECAADPDALLARVTEIALQATGGERAKLVDAQVSEHQREIENFERRIAKLTQSLQMTEEEMRRIAASKNIDPGVASVYRSVQGLNGEDEQVEIKKELMSTIFEANLELKRAIDKALPE